MSAGVDTAVATGAADRAARGRGPWRQAWVRLRRDPYTLAALCFLALVVVLAVLAPLISPYDPLQTDPRAAMQGPSGEHWLGTDNLGRDLFSRLINGARLSLAIGVLAAVVGAVVGTLLGVLAGYVRALDAVIMRLVDVVLAFPSILVALAVVAALGGGVPQTVIAVAVANVPKFVRLVRGQTLVLKERVYVEAARSAGLRGWRIVQRHLLPHLVGVVVVYTTVRFGLGIIIGATLGFLGLGVPPPAPEWGVMVADARQYLTIHPIMLFVPSVAILLVVVAANLLGDGLRDALDPKTQRFGGALKKLTLE
ncbi:MAG TPA: ABC transporter permease subunit [Streptosporangiales bacterium]